MNITQKIVEDLKSQLKKRVPNLTKEQRTRMLKIINPDVSDYVIYGMKLSEIEKIVKNVFASYNCEYDDAVEIFKILIRTNVEEEQFAGIFFLNRFKKHFNEKIIHLFKNEYSKYCHTWSLCDSTCIRVIGPFLGKKGNENLVKKIINDWSESENMWIKRASMVILIKIIMIKKDFDDSYVFDLVEKMLNYRNQKYIEKGIGWLLKTCSKVKPDSIFNYLLENKHILSRVILRYASEKLPNEKRMEILKK
jgi:3-methyladenine DNA glycosylase AlkD